MKVLGGKLQEHFAEEKGEVENPKKDGDVETKTDDTESETGRIGDAGQTSVHLDRL